MCWLFNLTSLSTMISSYYQEYSSFFTALMLGTQTADLIGPLWGGLLYNSIGYLGIFVTQACIILPNPFLLILFKEKERASRPANGLREKKINYKDLLAVRVRISS